MEDWFIRILLHAATAHIEYDASQLSMYLFARMSIPGFLLVATVECLVPEKLTSTMTSGDIIAPTQSASRGSTVRPFHNTFEPPPADALWIEFPKTDGDRNKWPVFAGERDNDGMVNFFRPVDINERSAVDWRKKVGKHLAECRNLSSMFCLGASR